MDRGPGFAGTTPRDVEQRMPRVTKVKNKQPGERQITAEQILRESKELQLEDSYNPPTQIITDPQELAEYRLKKRKEYEDLLRRVGRFNAAVWVKYATWEEGQKDFRRARSVWERALETSYRNVSYWLKYAEMEMRHRFINHARNVWDRAVQLLPRVDQLWYKYIHMEEMLGNVAGSRQVFQRWMRFEPDHQGWMAYIKFELRYQEVEQARGVYERYVEHLPGVKAWVRYAKFEFQHGDVLRARACYERAIEELGEDAQTEEFYIKFAQFEELAKEEERARAIFKYALDNIPKSQAQALYQRFVTFEKQHGDREGIEGVVVSKRRFQYEEEVQKNPLAYDSWFDYIKLEEGAGDVDRIREVYERAVANIPPGFEKRYWQRYIYLWIKYALFEELDACDPVRTREVYRACLKLIPHAQFTFAKIWILAAKFEIRQKRMDAARKILGMALGMAAKDKLFKAYIEVELQLGNIDRCRKLYMRYLEWSPSNCGAWTKFAELEKTLSEAERTRQLYELAISQPVLDMPEALWKAYIDFEIGERDRGRTRILYERLLDRTKHVKVWISFARFEAAPLPMAAAGEDDSAAAEAAAAAEAEDGPESAASRSLCARALYERAYRNLRENTPDAKEEAVLLLEGWKAFEQEQTWRPEAELTAAVEAVTKRMPRRVKRKRPVHTADGMQVGQEEYYDYLFPEESGAAPNLKLLEAAYRWKRLREEAAGAAAAQEAGGGDAGPAAEGSEEPAAKQAREDDDAGADGESSEDGEEAAPAAQTRPPGGEDGAGALDGVFAAES